MPGALDTRPFFDLLAAILIGVLVGIEREKSKAQAGHVGIGGVRTFMLFSLVGALGAWLAQALSSPLVLVAAIAAVAAPRRQTATAAVSVVRPIAPGLLRAWTT